MRILSIIAGVVLALSVVAPAGAQGASPQLTGAGRAADSAENWISASAGSGGDDTSAITSCIARGSCLLFAGKTYIAKNLLVEDFHSLKCNGSTITAPNSPAAFLPIVQQNGEHALIDNCKFTDYYGETLQPTTLSSAASAGARTVSVASGTNFNVGNLMSVALASGAHWTTEIKTVSGTTITPYDAIPYSGTALAVASPGVGCGSGDTVVLSGGTASTGGGPATAIYNGSTWATAVPGFYSTAPSNPVSSVAGANTGGGKTQCTTLPTFTMTWGGASSGAQVLTAIGAVLVDKAYFSTISNIETITPIGFQVQNSVGSGYNGTGNLTIQNTRGNAILASLYISQGVQNSLFDNFDYYGASYVSGSGVLNYANSQGYRGFYWTNRGGTGAGYAGDKFTNFMMQGFEYGSVQHVPFSAIEDKMSFDTNAYYGIVLNGPGIVSVTNLNLYATSPGIYSGPNFQGIGSVIQNGAPNNNNGAAWSSQFNAMAVWIADSASAQAFPYGSLSLLPQATIGGPGASYASTASVFTSFTGATTALQVMSGATIYLGPSGPDAGGYNGTSGWVSATHCVVNSVNLSFSAAPGPGKSYTTTLYNNGVSTGYSSIANGESTYNLHFSVEWYPIAPLDTLTIGVVGSRGAANTQIRYSVFALCYLQ